MNPIKLNVYKYRTNFKGINKTVVYLKLDLTGGIEEEREMLANAISTVFDEEHGKYLTPAGAVIEGEVNAD